MKIMLTLVCILSLVGCSNNTTEKNNDKTSDGNQTNSSDQVKQDNTKVFGRIASIDGNVVTLAIMENKGESELCPILPEDDTNKEGGTNDANSLGNDPANTGDGNVAKPVPEGEYETVFIDETGESKKITIDENTKVLYPNGTEASFDLLTTGSVIQINLDGPNGNIESITLLGA